LEKEKKFSKENFGGIKKSFWGKRSARKKIRKKKKEEKEFMEEKGLIQLIERGGIFFNVPGSTPAEVLCGLIKELTLPAGINREQLLQAVLEREALMSTAVGHGIALPHPRNSIVSGAQDECVAVGFLSRAVDWRALDREAVHTVLLIVSASAKSHLHTLSRINFFCHQESFRELLRNRASLQRISEVIRAAENAWT
jgi:PTS system nitrogen regulatory IIA component